MRSRILRLLAVLIVVTCLVCPVMEMFDRWNQTQRSGDDTEYAVVVLVLCIGVLYSFARVHFAFAFRARELKTADFSSSVPPPVAILSPLSFLLRIAISPPASTLRI
jgi:hypothetical protein